VQRSVKVQLEQLDDRVGVGAEQLLKHLAHGSNTCTKVAVIVLLS
jgi:hypothetical protein